MSNEVQLLEPKLQRFVHLYLTGQYNQTQLAQLLEVHKNTINSWLKREDVNIAIKEYQALEHEMIDVQIKAMRMKAIEKIKLVRIYLIELVIKLKTKSKLIKLLKLSKCNLMT